MTKLTPEMIAKLDRLSMGSLATGVHCSEDEDDDED